MRKVSLLDPRELANPPICESVNIPKKLLADRIFELPVKGSSLKIANVEGAEDCLRWLLDNSRLATLTDDFSFGDIGSVRLWSPNAFLEETAPRLGPGKALDLGCGVGREAVYLASAGWEVTAIDHLPDAIERGMLLAERYAPAGSIDWHVADLNPFPVPYSAFLPSRFDLITMHFYYDLKLVEHWRALLAPGGSLLIESFSDQHRQLTGKPRNPGAAICEAPLIEVLQGLEIALYSPGERDGRHTVRVWARNASE